MEEIWKDIDGFNDYQVSNLGRIKTKERNIYVDDYLHNRKYYKHCKEKIMKQFKDNHGYFTVTLNCKRKRVHRLVANAFLQKIKNKNIVNHIDGNKQNNRVDNLEFCTQKENAQHAFQNNLASTESAIKALSKKVDMFDLDMNYIRTFNSMSEAKIYLNKNKSSGRISEVCNKKRNKAYGYIWRYHTN